MQLHCSSILLHFLLAINLDPASRTFASPILSTATIPSDSIDAYASDPRPQPYTRNFRRGIIPGAMTIHGLPQPWTGIFKTLTSIQPSLHRVEFSFLFTYAAQAAAANKLSPGRSQRFRYGALILDFIPVTATSVVTPDFVEAASLWLRELVRNGWEDFFEAVVMDQRNGEAFYLHLANAFDVYWGQKVDLGWR